MQLSRGQLLAAGSTAAALLLTESRHSDHIPKCSFYVDDSEFTDFGYYILFDVKSREEIGPQEEKSRVLPQKNVSHDTANICFLLTQMREIS